MTEELSLVKRLRFALEEVRKAADRIEALEAENARLKASGSELYRSTGDLLVHHQAILLAWHDKASPESLIDMEKIRKQIFAAMDHFRNAAKMDAASFALGEKP